LEREFRKFQGIWDAFVDRVDADSSELNERLNHHRKQHNEMHRWCCSTGELAGTHKQQIERLTQDNVDMAAHIDALKMNLASLILRVNQMEGNLCRCGGEQVRSTFASVCRHI